MYFTTCRSLSPRPPRPSSSSLLPISNFPNAPCCSPLELLPTPTVPWPPNSYGDSTSSLKFYEAFTASLRAALSISTLGIHLKHISAIRWTTPRYIFFYVYVSLSALNCEVLGAGDYLFSSGCSITSTRPGPKKIFGKSTSNEYKYTAYLPIVSLWSHLWCSR